MKRPENLDAKLTILGPLFLLVGLYLAASVIPRALEVPKLDGLYATTKAIDGECGPGAGGFVDIEVDGQRHSCTVGEKCGRRGDLVAYDPDDPARCRDAGALGRIGPYERMSLVGVAMFLFGGSLITAYVIHRRRRKAAEIQAILDA